MTDDPLLDTDDAALFLKTPARTVEGWRYRGLGPAYIRLNRASVRYRRSDLLKYLERRTVVPANEEDLSVA